MAKRSKPKTKSSTGKSKPAKATKPAKSGGKAQTPPLSSPSLYINRELSWLEFNDRVLREGLNPDVPLLERMKFLAIVSSNLDEFFMIRVAGLKQMRGAGLRKRGPAGLSAAGQLKRIERRVRQMVHEQGQGIEELFALLAPHGISLVRADRWSDEQRLYLEEQFREEILPTLTPIALSRIEPTPLLAGMRLNLAIALQPTEEDDGEIFVAVVPIPPVLKRFITLPAAESLQVAALEDVITAFVGDLFPGRAILDTAVFRITRDGDVAVTDDDAGDLLVNIEEAVHQRLRRQVVRLELSAQPYAPMREYLLNLFDVEESDVFEIPGLLDAKALMDLATREGFEDLKYEDWQPQPPRDLIDSEDLYATLSERDVLLVHPYEQFDPVVELVARAGEDPKVLAIKQTLYRTAGNSPIVKALVRAAENGKQVTVLVELKARFDEARNVGWARVLEDAGCDVIYGVAGLKTHAKILLIVRREEYGIRRYLHLATGNYNDRTAKLYSDIGLMTTDRELAADASAFFNVLTGYSEMVGWQKLSVAPTGLRSRVLELIDREIRSSTKQQPGLIMAKMNSLQDPAVIRALYRASQTGVTVLLNIRGICCLRAGVPDVSDNIRVVSIVDRYLEHARIFYFRNGGHDEIYLSSADWMVRNLDKRLETFFPIDDPGLRARLRSMLEIYFADTVKARQLQPDDTWTPVSESKEPLRAQQVLYEQAVEAARQDPEAMLQFKPIRKER
jgi:polyphosphate kinase